VLRSWLLLPPFVLATACGGTGAPTPAPTLAASLERQIDVREDATEFTLFALLNIAGYDEENRAEGMHPVRVRIRRELDARIDPALCDRLRVFYQAHREVGDPWSYSVVAKATAGPPDFAPIAEWTKDLAHAEPFGQLAELHELLRRFYAEAKVPELYEHARPAYRDYIEQYRRAIYEQTAAALAYCRVTMTELTSSGERKDPLVIPNLLDSYERASSFVLNDRFTSIEGPQQRIGYNPHEFLHAVTNPAVYGPAAKPLEERLCPLVAEGTRALDAETSRDPSVAAYVDEELVRTISLRYLTAAKRERLDSLTRAMLDEYRSGHILERFFWEQLADFERGSSDIRQFYPTMLERLDPEVELERWREARAAS
jgi:hypothetical protein